MNPQQAMREAADMAAEQNGESYEVVPVGSTCYFYNRDAQATRATWFRHRVGVGFQPPHGFGSSCNAGSPDVQFIQAAR